MAKPREETADEKVNVPSDPKREQDHVLCQEELADMASEDSFPASDPPSYTAVTHAGKPKDEPVKPKERPAH
ncbi:MAG: hypothetical protein K2Q10_12990 [Rhodospirillales bacterium]|nr:hypothetical protein [Rhodospirillales bacterium]